MSACAKCGCQVANETALCPHHAATFDDGWAATNRAMCDRLHRGTGPVRLTAAERDDTRHLSDDF